MAAETQDFEIEDVRDDGGRSSFGDGSRAKGSTQVRDQEIFQRGGGYRPVAGKDSLADVLVNCFTSLVHRLAQLGSSLPGHHWRLQRQLRAPES